MKGKPIVFIGPSGSGKTTLAQYLMEHYDATKLVSTTSRPMRIGEQDGVQYYFKTEEEFKQMIVKDELLEYANYANSYYGVSKKEFEDKLDKAQYVVLVMELQGALKIRALYPNTTIICCDNTIDVLMQRMKDRGDSFESIKSRVKNYIDVKENELKSYADFVIEAQDIETSYSKLDSILEMLKI